MGTEADLRSAVAIWPPGLCYTCELDLAPVIICPPQPRCFQILFRWLNSSVTHKFFRLVLRTEWGCPMPRASQSRYLTRKELFQETEGI